MKLEKVRHYVVWEYPIFLMYPIHIRKIGKNSVLHTNAIFK